MRQQVGAPQVAAPKIFALLERGTPQAKLPE